MRLLPGLLGLVLAGVTSDVSADPHILRSGPAAVALVELFTSEGCSSCPPAERWLGALRSDAGLWREFVPVAFHVNYWDHLGWRDALASKAFTARQRRYAATWGAASVYTPGFVRNGAEWRPDGTRPAGGTPAVTDAGILTLSWDAVTRTGTVVFSPGNDARAQRKLEVTVALLGGGIVTAVRSGENAGRELHHEFVVLQIDTVALHTRQDVTGGVTGEVRLPARTDLAPTRQALAAWVTPHGDLAPLQAVGGWIE
ncbi:DUF1223 domain-containing protein [Horticoccus sp. 23ND18S-11]|uniref:DUF1223 domain-containing protein n=1 Tax=Horticoccus sp. 23ND18S-11 TaxID=3391832 RepID=UPI0039C8FB2B